MVSGGPALSYGTDRTDASGGWSVEASLLAGEYYVTVRKARNAGAAQEAARKKKKKKPKHRHKCQAGQSPTVQL